MTWARPLLFGHRGAPGAGIDENTMPSFERALSDGVTAIETDVHCTRDGHVVVSHDASLSRVFGVNLEIGAMTLHELQQRAPVPTLRELLERVPDLPINIDLKQRAPAMEAEVIRVIDEHNATDRVLLASFHIDVLKRVHALGYKGPTGLSRDEIVRLIALPTTVLKLWKIRGTRAQVPRHVGRLRFDTRAFIDKCHALGIAVDYWTINDVTEAEELLALGADGIMTDVPGIVRAAFASP